MGRGLSTEGNLHFKIDWASLIVARKFIVFALFYLVFEGNFQVQAPRGAFIWRGNLMEGFLRYKFGELIFGRAYIWRAYFRNFIISHHTYQRLHIPIQCLLFAQIKKYLLWGEILLK